MRIKLAHLTTYDYQSPAKSIIQLLRLTPRPHAGQSVVRWRVEIEADSRLHKGEDALGNITHTAYVAGPASQLAISVTGEVETWDTQGLVRESVERFQPEVFLRDTPLTQADAGLRTFAQDVTVKVADPLDRLHALMMALHGEVAFDTRPTDPTTTAAQAFALKKGVCQDLSQIFISAARSLGLPARYVSGHLVRSDGETEQDAAHAWAEAHAPGLGWVGFDPVNALCPTDAYIRVAVGLDYLGAAPVRGARTGGGQEHMDVKLHVAHASRQIQA